jgi:hypothetical protein
VLLVVTVPVSVLLFVTVPVSVVLFVTVPVSVVSFFTVPVSVEVSLLSTVPLTLLPVPSVCSVCFACTVTLKNVHPTCYLKKAPVGGLF